MINGSRKNYQNKDGERENELGEQYPTGCTLCGGRTAPKAKRN